MPEQDLGAGRVKSAPSRFDFRAVAARVVLVAVSAGLTTYAGYQMWHVINGFVGTWLQWGWFVLFLLVFGWIALAAGNAAAGLLAERPREDRAVSGPPRHRTALVMPIHNEDPCVTLSALDAMARGLLEQGGADGFELFILSDTRDPDVLLRETAAYWALRERLGHVLPVWYRRRPEPVGHKAGNIRSFVQQWGGRYDFMILLDADSLMAPETLAALVERMAADPGVGILQTAPVLRGGQGLLARLQQFAGGVYGPVVARGMAAWQGDAGSYWGHNAILRVRAFADACGLPRLPGRPPFGGPVLSHDFVESALMRRAGWKVRILPDTGGSWESSPPTLLDLAARDRRWAQGNLQHLRLLGGRGWAWPNRAHFAAGILSYLASPLWLALIAVGLVITVQALTQQPAYFSEPFQLFPSWPRFDAERMLGLFVFSVVVLCAPKILGLTEVLCTPYRRRAGGGAVRVLLSAAAELLLSALYAPILMVMQTRQVGEVLCGRDSGWTPQRRDSGRIDRRELWARHGGHAAMGAAVALVLGFVSPPLLAWLAPTLLGLVFAVPLSAASGNGRLGAALRRGGVFLTPEETMPHTVLSAAAAAAADLGRQLDGFSVQTLIDDPSARARHFAAVTPPPPPPRGRPDLVRLSAAAKIADAESAREAMGWLTADERRAVLADASLFESMVAAGRPPPFLEPAAALAVGNKAPRV